MAAGAGRRMGGRPKSLLMRDGETLLQRQLRLLRGAGVGPMALVLGHHAERIAAAFDPQANPDVLCVRNPDPDAGPGSSLRCGLAVLPTGQEAVLVALADQPLLEDGDTQAMLQAWQQRAPEVQLIVPEYAGQPGHPLVFGPQLRRAVIALPGGQGVRHWRQQHLDQVQALPVDHARYTTDVDTPDDIQQLGALYGIRLTWPPDS